MEPYSGMELDGDPNSGSGSPGGSEGDLIGPNPAALQTVGVAPPRRRSRSHGSPGPGQQQQQQQHSSDDEDDGWVPVSEHEVDAVMQRYRALQQEFVQQQLDLGPVIIPDNQALLEARVAQLMQQRSGKRLEAAEPAAAAAAGVSSSSQRPPDQAAAAAAGGLSGAGPLGGAAAAAGVAATDAAAASCSGNSRPIVVKFSSTEGRRYSKKAFRLAFEQRLPEYFSWSYLVRNELASAHGQCMFYTDETGETVPASDDEDAEQKPWNGPDGLSHDYALKKLAQEYSGRLPRLLSALETGMEQDAEMVTAAELAARLAFLHEQDNPKTAPTEQDRRRSSIQESMKALRTHFCRRCNIYNCRLHSGGHVQSACLPPSAPLAPDAPPCSSSCWKLQPQQATAGEAGAVDTAAGGAAVGAADAQQQQVQPLPAPDLSEYERSLLQQGLRTFGRDPCSLALLLLDRSCAQVGAFLAATPPGAGGAQDAAQAAAAEAAARRRKKNAKKGGYVPARRHVLNKRCSMSNDDLPPYSPCKCSGPCKKGSCSCVDGGNWCEKFCACVGCERRDCTFLGCSCTHQCRTERCPCMAAGRECDPDVCRNCSATALGTAPPDKACCNMGLRLRKHARIHMGLSSVSGWGAFLGQAAAKHDFLGEYVGELLTQAEADRRGKAYDRSNNSYLFGVNSAWVLDARDSGNKLRFANHRSQPNCHARVLMVDGDHRVGLYAAQDIAAGEELFYNYRYDLDNAPDWAIRS